MPSASGRFRGLSRHRATRWGLGLVSGAALLSLPAWLQNQYHVHVAVLALLFAILAMSLNLLLGYTGQLSLGHAAFFGIGGYTSALLNKHLGWPVFLGMLAALVTAGLAGYLIGRLSLRLRGAYFVLVSISFAGVVGLIAVNWDDLTNGPLGMPGVPAPEIDLPGSLQVAFVSKTSYYYLALAAAALSFVVCQRLVQSRFGRACIALRENEVLAQAVGIDGTRYLVITAVVSAALAGLAGSLYVHYSRFVSPEVFSFSYTITMVTMAVAGGKGTLVGPIVGAALFTVLPEVLRAATSYQWQLLAYGVLLILVVFFLPKGIVPSMVGWLRPRARRLGESRSVVLASKPANTAKAP